MLFFDNKFELIYLKNPKLGWKVTAANFKFWHPWKFSYYCSFRFFNHSILSTQIKLIFDDVVCQNEKVANVLINI